ncbi:MAG: sulfurtransferase TusA family protein [Clostridiaceae bacterium]|nr:sulfurtransferase TusA family protein [Eubacteriales bacterium]
MPDGIKVLDCFGDICPVPILKIQNELKNSERGDEFMVVTDHSCTIESIRVQRYEKPVEIRIEEVMNGVWEVYFKLA